MHTLNHTEIYTKASTCPTWCKELNHHSESHNLERYAESATTIRNMGICEIRTSFCHRNSVFFPSKKRFFLSVDICKKWAIRMVNTCLHEGYSEHTRSHKFPLEHAQSELLEMDNSCNVETKTCLYLAKARESRYLQTCRCWFNWGGLVLLEVGNRRIE